MKPSVTPAENNEPITCEEALASLFGWSENSQSVLPAAVLDHLSSCGLCSVGLDRLQAELRPGWVKRIRRIMDSPVFRIAACLAFALSFGFTIAYIPWTQEVKELLARTGLADPVSHDTRLLSVPDVRDDVPFAFAVGQYVAMKGRYRTNLFREVKMTVTPGLTSDAPYIEVKSFTADIKESAPFQFVFRNPGDGDFRTLSLEFIPWGEIAADPTLSKLLPAPYVTQIACLPGAPAVGVKEWVGRPRGIKRIGNRIEVTVQTSTAVGSWVALSIRGLKSDKPDVLEPKQVNTFGESLSWNPQIGVDAVELKAYAIRDGSAADLKSAILSGKLPANVLAGDQTVVGPPVPSLATSQVSGTSDSREASPTSPPTRGQFASAPTLVESNECKVVAAVEPSPGWETWLVLLPELAPDRCYVQSGVVSGPRVERTLILGGPPQRFTVLLWATPAGVITSDGERLSTDLDKLGVRLDSRTIDRKESGDKP